MPLSDKWTLGELRLAVRRELVDPSGRWWTDTELNQYISDWQNNLQEKFEFVWGTATVTTSTSTLTLTDVSTSIQRIDAIYWNNYRLSGRTKQDLSILLREWRDKESAKPYVAYQNDSRSLSFWPPPVSAGTAAFEFVKKLSLPADSSRIEVPAWTKYSALNYACYRAYLRYGPNHNVQTALRRKTKYERQLARFRTTFDNYLPTKYLTLRPGGKYESDILNPQSGLEVIAASMPITQFFDEIPTGTVNGTNAIFTLSVTPSELQLFLDGQLQEDSFDYNLSGQTITFVPAAVPPSGSRLRAFIVRL